MKWAKKIAVMVLVAAAGAWAYYANVASGRPAMDMNMRVTTGSTPFPVTIQAVQRGRVVGAMTYTGSVAAFNEEDIYPRVTGRIVEMPVYPGDRVERGQVVARLDSLELSSRTSEAEAGFAAAQATLAQAEADVTAAHHDVAHKEKELAQFEAEAEYQQKVTARDERLFTKGAIAQQELENSRAMAAAARAKLQAARENIAHAGAMLASAEMKRDAMAAMVAQSRSMARTAQIVRDYVTIVAPSNGVVVKRLVAPGVLVQPGMGILKITQIDKVRFQANVGEKDLPSIRVGSPVTVTLAGAASRSITAPVTSVFPFVDQGPRTAVVEAVVENRDHKFLPGQYVQMQFVTGDRPDALSVPARAVVRLGGKATVWVVENDRAVPREATTGLENPDRVEITRGLVGTERVVVTGHEGLYAGARVRDVSAPAAQGQEGDQHKGMPGMKEPGPSGASEAPAPEAAAHGTDHGTGQPVAQAPTAGREGGDLRISLSPVPSRPRIGDNTLRIEVKDRAGAPVSGAKVEVSAGMPGMAGPRVAARPAKEPGIYEATVNLGMAGAWTVEVVVTRPQGGITSAKFNLEAK